MWVELTTRQFIKQSSNDEDKNTFKAIFLILDAVVLYFRKVKKKNIIAINFFK